LYGAAEFSRDIDLSIGIDAKNINAVRKALEYLKAETIFVPALDEQVLKRGHACHFRCHAEGVERLRIDLMAKMRGCSDFKELWNRRSIVQLPDIGEIGILALSDLIQAKKTQREKDWPMIRRLIETDIIQNIQNAEKQKIVFWLKECRTPGLLVQLSKDNYELCKQTSNIRPLLKAALENNINDLESLLLKEQMEEKERDRKYWRPLREELEKWRHEQKI
jgi:hypothetical protein